MSSGATQLAWADEEALGEGFLANGMAGAPTSVMGTG
jgi:hypothetical protein